MHKHTFATGPGAYILNYTLEIVSEAVSGDKYHSSDSPVCSLHLVVEAGVNLMKSGQLERQIKESRRSQRV